jgi:hypothetical protein
MCVSCSASSGIAPVATEFRDGRAGSVTVIQRFGGGLNLNVHYQRAV